jgi:pimeloyl-ACP methyl ester carboxylesterase
LLLHGGSGLALDWWLVQPELARQHRVCSYDRAGQGWSPASAGVDSDQSAANDLFAALAAADERPPYVLVGAGSGAMVARLLQLDHPNDVAGAVFVDGFHEDQAVLFVEGQPTPARALSAAAVRSELEKMRPRESGAQGLPAMPQEDAPYDRLPAEVLSARVTFDLRAQRSRRALNWDAQMAIFLADYTTFVRVHESAAGQTPPLGDRPVISLRPGIDPAAAFKGAASKLATLSTNGVERTVEKAGPEIHLWDPAAVVAAIREVSQAAASGPALR